MVWFKRQLWHGLSELAMAWFNGSSLQGYVADDCPPNYEVSHVPPGLLAQLAQHRARYPKVPDLFHKAYYMPFSCNWRFEMKLRIFLSRVPAWSTCLLVFG